MRRVTVFVAVLVGVMVAGCGSDDTESEEPDRGGAVATTASLIDDDGVVFGLESAVLPASEAEVAAVLEAMPDELEGQPRVGDEAEEGVVARYGGQLIVLSAGKASDVEAGTVLEDLARFEDEPGAEIETSQLDPDADLVFVVGSFRDDGGAGKVYVATWGDPDGDWLFSAGAPSPELREALVRAFVEAAR